MCGCVSHFMMPSVESLCVSVWKRDLEMGSDSCLPLSSSLLFYIFLQQLSPSHSQAWSSFNFLTSLAPSPSLLFGSLHVSLHICCVPAGKFSSHVIKTYIPQTLATYFTVTLGFTLFSSCFGFGYVYCCLLFSKRTPVSFQYWDQMIALCGMFWIAL